jgi:hypothetical protein
MRLSYRRTFSQFADSHLASHYAIGRDTLRRIALGPLAMLAGALIFFIGRRPALFWLLRGLFVLLGLAVLLYGLFLALRPFIDLALVYLRREDFLGPEGQPVSLELLPEALRVTDGDTQADIPFKDILAVKYRAAGAWIITKSDYLIAIPADLTEGDADAFLAALDAILNPPEEQ